jgi:hypothetical protein
MRASSLQVVFALLLAACSGAKTKGAENLPPQLLQLGTFRHDQHLSLELDDKHLSCGDCHVIEPDRKYQILRPGTKEHAPCDNCHEDAFMRPPGALCMVCHAAVDPVHAGKSPLLPYPRQKGVAELVARFDHRAHVPRVKERIKEGGQFPCEACHTVKDKETALATFPVHADCAQCHGLVSKPEMGDCMACHAETGPVHERKFVSNDVRFTHGKHREDKSGDRIACVTCHHTVLNSSRASDLNLPEMKDCAQCHEDPARTPDRVRITRCGLCHLSDKNRVDLPGDHTP